MRALSIKTKIVLFPGLCLLLAGALVIFYSVDFLKKKAVEDAKQQIIAITRSEAASTRTEFAVALNVVKTMASLFAKVKDQEAPLDLQRYEAFDLLRGNLFINPNFAGVFTCWEPNAFDFMDAGFSNERGHDASGRLAFYWHRDDEGGAPRLAPLLEMADHSKNGQPGPWYEEMKKLRTARIIGPFFCQCEERHNFLTAMAIAPIIVDNEFLGIVGIDIDLSFLQNKADELGKSLSGEFTIISSDQTIVAHTGVPEFIGTPMQQYKKEHTHEEFGASHSHGAPEFITSSPQEHEKEHSHEEFEASHSHEEFGASHSHEEFGALFSHEEIVSISNKEIHTIVPMPLGTGTPWSVHIATPLAPIIAPSLNLMWRQISILAAILGVMIFFAFIGARKITRPLSSLIDSIVRIKDGDFSREIKVESRDEVGELAATFDRMRIKIRQTLAELHQHQERLEDMVAQRTVELEVTNEELNDTNTELVYTLESLREVQDELLKTEKLAVVGQMSGIVAHEVLNPISAVSIRIEKNIQQAKQGLLVVDKLGNLAQELREQDSTPEVSEKISLVSKIAAALKTDQQERLEDWQTLERLIQRVIKIIDGLRQMSKTRKHPELLQLDHMIREVAGDMADSLNKRNIEIVQELQSVPVFEADHMEMYSIVSNLLRNSMQALEKTNDPENRRISLELTVPPDSDSIELLVRDNGIGIRPEDQKRVFEPGYTDKGRDGTGLGLSFSRKVARSYSGDIVLKESEPGLGTTFIVTFPLTDFQ